MPTPASSRTRRSSASGRRSRTIAKRSTPKKVIARACRRAFSRTGTDDPKTRRAENIQIQGLRPVFFEHTAWDLALATQSLADIDPDLAFDLSRIYGLQSRYEDQTRSIMQTVYMRPMLESLDSLWYYYNDAVMWDTALLRMSEEVLPKIDRELGN